MQIVVGDLERGAVPQVVVNDVGRGGGVVVVVVGVGVMAGRTLGEMKLSDG